MLSLIWAEAQNGTIGNQGQMPWHSHEDMVHFRHVTTGHPVVMGWKTFCSLGQKPLPHRDNYVLTHRQQLNGVKVISLEQVKQLAADDQQEVFVIGGASVYSQLLPDAQRLYRTVLESPYPGETKMPPINYDQWQLIDRQRVTAKKAGEPNCEFQRWQLNI